MLNKIDHLGIAVKDLQNSIALYTKLLGIPPYKEEIVESEGVKTVFFQIGESKIELLEALHDKSPISNFLAKRGDGLHHIAMKVDDITSEIDRLKAEGFTFLSDEPKQGANNKKTIFMHPKTTGGILIELCQDK